MADIAATVFAATGSDTMQQPAAPSTAPSPQDAEGMVGTMAFAAPTGTDVDNNTLPPQEAEGMVGAMAFAVPTGTDADHNHTTISGGDGWCNGVCRARC